MRKYFFFLPLFVSFLFLSDTAAFAQSVPSGQTPAAQAKRYQAGVEEENKTLGAKEPKPPQIEIKKKKAKAPITGPTIILKGIRVIGSTVFKPQDFKMIYEPYLDKKVTFGDVETMTKKMEEKYRKEGYFTTIVYIPQQKIKDGIIEIRVAEGRAGQIRIEGHKWFSHDFIRQFIHLGPHDLLNIKTLQRDMLRLNRNSDLEVKSVLSQGKEAQTSDIFLKVEDKFPWHVGISEDNHGTRLTGFYRTSYTLRSSNLTGHGDTFFTNTTFSHSSFGQSASYSIPLGTYGTKFYFDATYFKMKIGKEYLDQDITGSAEIYTPHVSWELTLKEDYQANFNLGMDIKSIMQKKASVRSADDQMRLPWFSFDFLKIDSSGQTSFSPRFTFGTSGFLGASRESHPSGNRPSTGGSFFKYSQSLDRTQKMPFDSYMLLHSQFQAASHTLASSEQMQLGGAYSIRGYPEGDYLADTGGFLNVNWVFPNYLIPRDWRLKGQKTYLRHQIQPVIFVDCGGGGVKKLANGEKARQFLAGAGGGLQFQFTRFSILIEWAKALGGDRPISGSGPSTFYLTFQSEI